MNTGQRAAAVARLLSVIKDKGSMISVHLSILCTDDHIIIGTVIDFPLDDDGRTITMLAAQKGDIETAQFFIRKGANPNYYISRRLIPNGSSARSALAFAISSGQLEVVQSLLAIKGIDVDPSDTRLQLPKSTNEKGKESKGNDDDEDDGRDDEGEDDDDDDEGEEEGATPLDLSVRLNSPTSNLIAAELLSAGADVTSRFEVS